MEESTLKEYRRLLGMSMETWLKRFVDGKEKPLLSEQLGVQ